MVYFRVQSDFTYRVITGTNQTWYFTVYVDSTGQAGFRDLVSPQGPVRDAYTATPVEVLNAINQAVAQVGDIMVATSAVSGQATFDEATSVEIVFDTPMSGTQYRVHLDAPDFITTRVKYKSTTGFIIEVGSTYTGVIGYDVFI